MLQTKILVKGSNTNWWLSIVLCASYLSACITTDTDFNASQNLSKSSEFGLTPLTSEIVKVAILENNIKTDTVKSFLAFAADGQVAKFNTNEKNPTWKTKFPLGMRGFAKVASTDFGFLVGIQGQLRLIDLRNGQELGNFDDPKKETMLAALATMPANDNYRVFLRSEVGSLVAVDLPSSKRLWAIHESMIGTGNIELAFLDETNLIVASQSKILLVDHSTGSIKREINKLRICDWFEQKPRGQKSAKAVASDCAESFAVVKADSAATEVKILTSSGRLFLADLNSSQLYSFLGTTIDNASFSYFEGQEKSKFISIAKSGDIGVWNLSEPGEFAEFKVFLDSDDQSRKVLGVLASNSFIVSGEAVGGVSLLTTPKMIMPDHQLDDSRLTARLDQKQNGEWNLQLSKGSFISETISNIKCETLESERSQITKIECLSGSEFVQALVHQKNLRGSVMLKGDDSANLACTVFRQDLAESSIDSDKDQLIDSAKSLYCEEVH